MIYALISIPIVLATVYLMVKYVCPFTNRFFAMVWNERDDDKQAVLEKIQKLYVDGDVPEETALMMASTESGQSRESILNAFNTTSAVDLANIIRKRSRNAMLVISQLLESGYKRGMK